MTEEINLNNLQRQEILIRLAIESVGQYSEKYVAMIQAIDELILLTEYEPNKYEKSVLEYCRKKIGIIESYSNGLKSGTEDKEDITSKRFITYRRAESQIYSFYPILKKLQLKLIEKTTLKAMTIPSSHLNIARKSTKRVYEQEQESEKDEEEDDEED